jgi:hypothetical protein
MLIGHYSKGDTQLFNVNLYPPADSDDDARMCIPSTNHIIGLANETLPYLVASVGVLTGSKSP